MVIDDDDAGEQCRTRARANLSNQQPRYLNIWDVQFSYYYAVLIGTEAVGLAPPVASPQTGLVAPPVATTSSAGDTLPLDMAAAAVIKLFPLWLMSPSLPSNRVPLRQFLNRCFSLKMVEWRALELAPPAPPTPPPRPPPEPFGFWFTLSRTIEPHDWAL